MNMASKLRRKNNVAARQIAGDSFLIPVCGRPIDMENIFVLNPLAEFIWQRLDGEHTLEDIHAEIVEHFDVAPERARGDAVDFVDQLLANGLAEEAK